MVRDTLATPGFRSRKMEKAWFADLDLYGPGGLIAWGVHNTDRLRWWFGCEADWVLARSYSLRTEIPDDISSNMLMVSFQGGGSAQLIYSEALPPPGRPGFACGAQLVGEEGLMDVDPYNQVRVARKGSSEWETVYDHSKIDDPRQKAFTHEVRDFVGCIVEDTASRGLR